jgi:phytanoyl-CoA hydroxylase
MYAANPWLYTLVLLFMTHYKHQTFILTEHLTEEQKAFFANHGFIHFKNFLNTETVNTFIREIETIYSHLIAHEIEKINGIPLRYGLNEDDKPIIHRLVFASHYSNILREFLNSERLLALLPLLGKYSGRISENEKDGLVVNHFENTESSTFKQMGWHTDSPRDLFLGKKIMPMLNVGIHLDDCPFENGGLRVIPGTHKQSLFSLLFKKKYFFDTKADPNEVGFDIEAGDLTVHDGNIWHRVQESPFTGEKSKRRVMYIPIITGKYHPRSNKSATPFYHKVASFSAASIFKKKTTTKNFI